jgi:hypothetical protein
MSSKSIRELLVAWVDGSTLQWCDDKLDIEEDDWDEVPDEDIHKLKSTYLYRKNKKFRIKPKVKYIVPYYWITYHEVEADSRAQALDLAAEIEVNINAYVNDMAITVDFNDMGEPELELQ